MYYMETKRDQTVTLRFTEDELDRIDEQAAREGRDRSGLLRWAVTNYLHPEGTDK